MQMEQLNLLNDFFDGGRPEFKIENKIRLIELFARLVLVHKLWL
jgi:hypothetical protein